MTAERLLAWPRCALSHPVTERPNKTAANATGIRCQIDADQQDLLDMLFHIVFS